MYLLCSYLGMMEAKCIPTNIESNNKSKYENAINFYTKIISDVSEYHYPPTLFGIDYSPAMFITLKGYITAALGLIGFFGYKSFFGN